jgi:hypothetical protein
MLARQWMVSCSFSIGEQTPLVAIANEVRLAIIIYGRQSTHNMPSFELRKLQLSELIYPQ